MTYLERIDRILKEDNKIREAEIKPDSHFSDAFLAAHNFGKRVRVIYCGRDWYAAYRQAYENWTLLREITRTYSPDEPIGLNLGEWFFIYRNVPMVESNSIDPWEVVFVAKGSDDPPGKLYIRRIQYEPGHDFTKDNEVRDEKNK